MFGVESICKLLPIAPSTYYRCKQHEYDPELRCQRQQRDDALVIEIKRIYADSHRCYGARKIWHQLHQEGITVARCTVERLMRNLGLQGIRRGKPVFTTVADDNAAKPTDLVNRQFNADRPNQLWVADITYVRTGQGFVYVAFVIDVFSRYIVGWQALQTLRTRLALDALEQAYWARGKPRGVIHHSDRGKQYLSVHYSQRLLDGGFKASVGSVGDSYDNALAETINGLYKTEVINRAKPWKGLEDVKQATLAWVDWFNKRRLLSTLGYQSPAEYEASYYRLNQQTKVA